jgi:hypothetical protein
MHSLRFFHMVILLMMVICLLTALVPLADFDFDGLWDSFLTDGLVLLPNIFLAPLFVFLLTDLPVAFLATPRLFSSLIVPPPNIF